MLNNTSIKTKLLMLIIVPLIATFIFAGIVLTADYKKSLQQTQMKTSMELSKKVSSLVHESQKEREMTAVFIASEGQKFAEELPKQRLLFDQKRAELVNTFNSLPVDSLPPTVFSSLQENISELTQIDQLRKKVSNLKVSAAEAVPVYTSLNSSLINWIGSLVKFSKDAEVSAKIISLDAFLTAKDRAGIERAVLTNVFAKDHFMTGRFVKLITFISEQNTYLALFELTTTKEILAVKNKLFNSPVAVEVLRLRNIALDNHKEGGFGIDPAHWFKVATANINLLKEIEDKLFQDAIALTANKQSKAQSALINEIILLLVMVLILAILGTLIVRSISRNVSNLTSAMQQTTSSGDFSIRAKVIGSDELASIAKTYNKQMSSIETSINKTNNALAELANGNFDVTLDMPVKGDLAKLQTGLNDSAGSISFMMSELNKVMQAIQQGVLDHTMDTKVPLSFRTGIEKTLQELNLTINEVNKAIQALAAGEFSYQLKPSGQGSILELENGVNNSINNVRVILEDVGEVVQKSANNDLTGRVSATTSGGFSTLKDSINQMQDNLSEFLSNIQELTNVLSTNANNISEEMHQISSSSQSQAASVEQTAASLEQITASVSETEHKAAQAEDIARSANDKVATSMTIMEQSMRSMEEIKIASAKIAEITTLIDGISFQTNLLALNAAVEAARAGEHGRGFAVVAAEVRNLAGRSADAATDIKKLIDDTINLVEAGSQQSKNANDAVTEVNDSISQVVEVINEISGATKEQATGVKQINQAMTSIDTAVQNNSIMALEASEHAETMKSSSSDVQNLLNKLRVKRHNRLN